MTPFWQEKCVYVGQQEVFVQGSETLKFLTGQYVSAKQIERMSHAYGQLLETKIEGIERSVNYEPGEVVYGMMDGSMVLTREDDWKEMKLARIFSNRSLLPENEGRNFIKDSTYVAHLGGKDPFLHKVEQVINEIKSMVWVADGAKWIWIWLDTFYPEFHQILDFFHASEKLHEFAREAFKDEDERKIWVDHQHKLLKDNGVEIVMINVGLVACRGRAKERQTTLLTYYENNIKRMQYKDYLEKSWLIGSGPIESANKTVIQQRMKLSGQRWTVEGAQQVTNLRVAEKSGQWEKVKQLICHPA